MNKSARFRNRWTKRSPPGGGLAGKGDSRIVRSDIKAPVTANSLLRSAGNANPARRNSSDYAACRIDALGQLHQGLLLRRRVVIAAIGVGDVRIVRLAVEPVLCEFRCERGHGRSRRSVMSSSISDKQTTCQIKPA